MEIITQIVVGKVHFSVGEVVAVSPDGHRRALAVGDSVHRDDIVTTGANGAVHIDLSDNQVLELSYGQEATLSANTLAQLAAGSSDEFHLASVQEALAEGIDPDALLPASQAGVDDLDAEDIEALPPTEAGETEEGSTENIGFEGLPVVELSGLIGEPAAGFETTTFQAAPLFVEDDVSLDSDSSPAVPVNTVSVQADLIIGDAAAVMESDDSYLVYDVQLSQAVADDVPVTLSTAGTAVAGSDYASTLQYNQGTSQTPDWVDVPVTGLTLPADARAVQVRVQVLDDTVTENAETVILRATTTSDQISNADSNTGVIADTGTGTITDDGDNNNVDGDVQADVQISDAGSVVEANDSYLVYEVQLSQAVADDVPVSLGIDTSSTATAGDYDGTLQYNQGTSQSPDWVDVPAGGLILPADAGAVQVRVQVLDDTVTENAETVILTATTTSDQVSNADSATGVIADTGTGTITDDGDNNNVDGDVQADVQISDAGSVVEANDSYLVYEVQLSQAVADDVPVILGIDTSSTATAGDYDGTLQYNQGTSQTPNWVDVPAGGLTLPADASAVQVRVQVLDDTVTENAETVILTATTTSDQVSNADSNTGVIADTGTGTITDDGDNNNVDGDVQAEVQISDAAPVVEADDSYLVYDVQLSQAVADDVPVTLSTAGMAVADSDYEGTLQYNQGTSQTPDWVDVPAGGLTLSADASAVQVRVQVLDDTVTENAETVILTATTTSDQVSNADSNTGVIADTGTGTITDDGDNNNVDGDVQAEVQISDAAPVVEANDSYLVYDVQLSQAVADDVPVTLSTAGTAVAGSDYASTLQYNQGTSQTPDWVDVPVTGLTLPADARAVQVRVQVLDDTVTENAETVILRATTTSDQISNADSNTGVIADTGTGTITDDGDNNNVDGDVQADVQISDAGSVVEANDSYLVYEVQLSQAVADDVPVSLGIDTSSTATAGDYDGTLQYNQGTSQSPDWVDVPAGGLILPADAGAVQVRVQVLDDTVTENAETVILTATTTSDQVSNADSATGVIADTGTGTITDDGDNNNVDGDVQADVQISDAGSVVEANDSYLVYEVQLSQAVADDVPVILGIDTSSTATAGDYDGTLQYNQGTSQTPNWVDVPAGGLTLPADASAVQVRVQVLDDTVTENAETVILTATTTSDQVSNADSNTGVIADTGTGTITDDGDNNNVDGDVQAEVQISDAAPVVEADDSYLVYDVQLSQAVADDVPVTLSTAGMAVADSDYEGTLQYNQGTSQTPDWVDVPAGGLTLSADASAVQVRVQVLDDTVTENAETVILTATTTSDQVSNADSNTGVIADTGTGTITDDGDNNNVDGDVQAEVQISDAAPVVEANDSYLVYDVQLSQAVADDVPVTLSTAGTAVAGSDYASTLQYNQGTSQTPDWVDVPVTGLTLPADASAVQVRVQVLDDTETESPESVVLTATTTSDQVSNADSTTGMVADTGTGTITDDGDNNNVDGDVQAEVQISDAGSVVEANDSYLVYDVQLSQAVANDVPVTLSTAGIAVAGSDYAGTLQYNQGTSQTPDWVDVPVTGLTLPADASAVQVRVQVLDDTVTENAESVILTATTTSDQISNADSNTGVIADTGTGTITDDGDNNNVDGDVQAEVQISDAGSVEEANDSYLVYDVQLSQAVANDVPVTLSIDTDNSTATAGDDYTNALEVFDPTANSGTGAWVALTSALTLPADASAVQVRVQVLDDTETESPENVVLTATTTSDQISNADSNTGVIADTGTGTITDDGDNNNVDGDVQAEVQISDAGSVEEANDSYLVYDVQLSQAVADDVPVTLSTAGTAVAGSDYASTLQYNQGTSQTPDWVDVPAGGLTLPADASAVQVRVQVLDDTETESPESVVLTATTTSDQISNADSQTGVIADTGTGTITDDGDNNNVDGDVQAEVQISDAGSVVEANDSYLVYDVQLSQAVADDVPVTLSTAGTAVAGSDYASTLQYNQGTSQTPDWVDVPAGGLTLPADASAVQVRVQVLDDTETESPENVVLTATTTSDQISNADSNTGVIADTGTGTITDDGDNNNVDGDVQADVQISDAGSVVEANDSYLVYDVQLSQAVADDVPVTLSTAGTAVAGSDYVGTLQYNQGTSQTPNWIDVPAAGLTLPADASAVQVRVQVLDDTVTENAESVILTATTSSDQISNADSNTGVIADTGTGTITDDGDNNNVDGDVQAEVQISDAGSVEEANDSYLVYDVQLSQAVADDVPVTLSTAGTAVAGSDYASTLQYNQGTSQTPDWVDVPAGGLTLPADASAVQVRVQVLDDTETESPESVVLTATTTSDQISNADSQTGVIADTGTGTITDDGDNNNVDGDVQAEVQISDAGSVVEANDSYLVYDVQLSQAVADDVPVTLSTAGTAVAGSDYVGTLQYNQGTSQTPNWIDVPAAGLTLPADASAVQVRVQVLDDTVTENAESVILTATTSSDQISNADSNTGVIADTGTGIITDDGDNNNVDGDVQADVQISDAGSVVEANDSYLVYDVQLSQAVANDVPVTLSTAGIAVAGSDYAGTLQYNQGTSQTPDWVDVPVTGLTLPADASAVQVRVQVLDDTVTENAESVILRATTTSDQVSNADSQTGVIADTGTGTITDDGDNNNVDGDVQAEVQISDAGSVVEANDSYLVYDVQLSQAVANDVPVTLSTAGNAVAGSDYAGTLQYNQGTSQTPDWVDVPAGGLTLPADASAVQVRVQVLDDTVTENAETVILRATTTSDQVSNADSQTGVIADTGTGTITDDGDNNNVDGDVQAEVQISDAAPVVEADDSYLVYDVQLSQAVADDVPVTLSTAGMAVADSDYEGTLQYNQGTSQTPDWVDVPAGGLTLSADASAVQVRVQVLDDTVTENAETVILTATTTSDQVSNADSNTGVIADTGTGTITDDGDNNNVDGDVQAEVQISDAAPVVEADDSYLVYEVQLSQAVADDVPVTLSTAGNAVAGSDYVGTLQYNQGTSQTPDWIDVPAGGLTLPADASAVQVRVQVLDDTVTENAESVILTATTSSDQISNADSNTGVIADTGTGTITDDGDNNNVDGDVQAEVQISDAGSVEEANDSYLVYDVQLSQAVADDVPVTLSTAGTAVAGSDYASTLQYNQGTSQTPDWVDVPVTGLTLPADASAVQVRVQVLDDTETESPESVVLTATTTSDQVSNADSNSGVIADTGTGTITDDGDNNNVDGDVQAEVQISDAGSVVEANDSYLVYDVQLSQAVANDVPVTLSTAGIAVAGSDYAGTLQYNQGTSQTPNWVDVPAGGLTLPADASAVQVRVQVLDDTVTENAESVILTATTTSDQISNADSNTGVIADTGTGTITDDGDNNSVDGDVQAEVQISDAGSVVEANDSYLVYDVQLSQAVADDVPVTLSTAGTAVAGSDYASTLQYNQGTSQTPDWVDVPAGGLTLPADASAVQVRVQVLDDTETESPESVVLTATTTSDQISNADSQTGVIADTGTGTITDDGDNNNVDGDVQAEVQISDAGSVVEANDSYLVYDVQLSQAVADDVPVTLSTAGTAVAGSDYVGTLQYNQGTSQTPNWIDVPAAGLTLPADASAVQVRVQVLDDTVTENAESVILTATTSSDQISNADSNTGVIADTGTGIITDDGDNNNVDGDVQADVQISDAGSVVEANDSYLVYDVQLSQAVADDVPVTLSTAGTAVAGSDYASTLQYNQGTSQTPDWIDVPAGGLILPADASAVQVRVQVLDDTETESPESVVLTATTSSDQISNADSNTGVIADTGTGTITDDGDNNNVDGDVQAEVQISDAGSVEEANDSYLVYEVQLSQAVADDVPITLSTAGTAVAGSDYASTLQYNQGTSQTPNWVDVPAGGLTLPADARAVQVRVQVLDDTETESPESVVLTATTTSDQISNADSNTGVIADTGTGTITDDGDNNNVDGDVQADVQISDAGSVVEANDSYLVYDVQLSQAVANDVPVTLSTAGNAVAGSDYAGTLQYNQGTSQTPDWVDVPAGGLTLPADASAVQVRVQVLDDTVTENAETVILRATTTSDQVSNADSQTGVIADTGTGTITDDGDNNNVDGDVQAEVQISDAGSVVEANDSYLVYDVQLSQAVANDVPVTLSTAGTAVAGSDYVGTLQYNQGTSQTPDWVDVPVTGLTLPADARAVQVRVQVLDDTVTENAETVILTATTTSDQISNADSQTGVIADTGTGTITDDGDNNNVDGDVQADVQISDAGSVVEANDSYLVYEVQLSQAVADDVPVSLGIDTSSTATAGDYAGTLQYNQGTSQAPDWVDVPAGGLTLPADASAVQVRVQVLDDTVTENAETVILRATTTSDQIGNADSVTGVVADTGTGTITDDGDNNNVDGDVQADVQISDAGSVVEANDSYLVYEVQLSQAVADDVPVSLGIDTSSTATAGDYAGTLQYNQGTSQAPDWVDVPAGGLTLPADASAVQVRVQVLDDTVTENAETVILRATTTSDQIGNADSVTGVVADTGTGTITDDGDNNNVDGDVQAEVQISDASSVVEANDSYLVYEVQLSQAVANDVPVILSTAGTAAAGSDYDGTLQYNQGTSQAPDWVDVPAGGLILPADAGAVQVRVQVLDDTVTENAETVILTATTTSDQVSNADSATGVIADTGTGTITDDGDNNNVDGDVQAEVQISDAGSVVEANDSYLVYDVQLSQAVANDVPVTLSTAGNAVAGSDYVGTLQYNQGTSQTPDWVDVPAGGLTLPADASAVQVRVQVLDDTVTENAETVILTATTASDQISNADSTTGVVADTGTGTITDDGDNNNVDGDVQADVQISDAGSVVEANDSYLVYEVQLSQAVADDVPVTLSTAGNAVAGSDYAGTLQYNQGTSQTPDWVDVPAAGLTLPADASAVQVRVQVLDDTETESPENVVLTATTTSDQISNADSNTGVIADTGTGTITDDGDNNNVDGDVQADVQISDAGSVVEANDSYLVYEVQLSQAVADDVPVTLSIDTNNSTATAGDDYTNALEVFDPTANSGTGAWVSLTGLLTLPADASVVQVRVPVLDDTITETAETVILSATTTSDQISNADSNTGVIADTGTGTITDNDLNGDGEDDDVPVISLQASDDSAQEGTVDDSVVFTIDRSFDNGGSSSVVFNLGANDAGSTLEAVDISRVEITDSDGTTVLSDQAEIEDFLNTGRAISLSGSDVATITLFPQDDILLENEEAFSGRLSNPTGAVLGDVKDDASFRDGGDADTGTIQAIVHESALEGGSGRKEEKFDGNDEAGQEGGQGVTIATGLLSVADGPISQVNGEPLEDGWNTIRGDYGQLVINSQTGAYTYTLTDVADHSADVDVFDTFAYETAGSGTALALNIEIVDDQPVARNQTVEIPDSVEPVYRVAITLDLSDSMKAEPANGVVKIEDGVPVTRLDIAKEAIAALLEEFFEQSTDVEISLVTFNGGGAGDDRIYPEIKINAESDLEAALASLDSISNDDTEAQTFYSDAISETTKAFANDDGLFLDENDPRQEHVEYISYFISDGAPTDSKIGENPRDAANEWETFTSENGVTSYYIGVGSNINDGAKAVVETMHNVDSLQGGGEDSAIIVSDEEKLLQELLKTAPTSYGGNLVNNGQINTIDFGADEGYIQSVKISLQDSLGVYRDVLFSYSPDTNKIQVNNVDYQDGSILNLNGRNTDYDFSQQGTLIFNFSTGDYTYYPSNNLQEGDSFTLEFTVADNDGDTTAAPGVATIVIADAVPNANNDSDTIMPGQGTAEGNVITGIGTDQGISADEKSTPFTVKAGGVDDALDNARVTSVFYQGQETLVPENGQVTLTLEGGSQLVFSSTGYYRYEPAVSNSIHVSDHVDADFSAAGFTLESVPGVEFSSKDEGKVVLLNDGKIGVGNEGSTTDGTIEVFEELVIEFNKDDYPDGVTNIALDLTTKNDKRALTLTLYSVDGAEIGQLHKSGEDVNTDTNDELASYSNVGRVEISAGSSGKQSAKGEFKGISFDKVEAGVVSGTESVSPHEITYVLTDEDGDTDTAVLTLTSIQNKMFGTEGDDLPGQQDGRDLSGTQANDYISGLGGDDLIDAGDGHDILIGGAGNDILQGGNGTDNLSGNEGDDSLQGGAGSDLLRGGAGNDIVKGGAGDDELYGDSGNDILDGGSQADHLYGGSGNDQLTGGDGSDRFAFDIGDLIDGATEQTDIVTDFALGHPDTENADILDLSALVDFGSGENLDPQTLIDKGLDASYAEDSNEVTLTFTADTSDTDDDVLHIKLQNTAWDDAAWGGDGSTLSGEDVLKQLIDNGQIII